MLYFEDVDAKNRKSQNTMGCDGKEKEEILKSWIIDFKGTCL